MQAPSRHKFAHQVCGSVRLHTGAYTMHDVGMAKLLQKPGFTAKAFHTVHTVTLQGGLDRPDPCCFGLVREKHLAKRSATETPIAEILSKLAPEVVVPSETVAVRVDRTIHGFCILHFACRYYDDAVNQFIA